jgi:uncharacterized protein YeeX (DUF496 family)
MNDTNQKDIVDILQTFNRNVSNLLKMVSNFSPNNPDIDCIRRIVKILRDTNPEGAMEKCMAKLWDNQQQIRERNADFFMNCPMDKYIKKDANKQWLDGIVRMVRSGYTELSEDELNAIWKCINSMLVCVIKYKLLVQDHTK